MKNDKKTKQLNIVMDSELKNSLKKLADSKGLTLSAFVRMTLTETVKGQ